MTGVQTCALPIFDELPEGYAPPDCLAHRAVSAAWLRAQVTDDYAEIKHLHRQVSKKAQGASSSQGKTGRPRRKLGNGDGVEWTDAEFTRDTGSY